MKLQRIENLIKQLNECELTIRYWSNKTPSTIINVNVLEFIQRNIYILNDKIVGVSAYGKLNRFELVHVMNLKLKLLDKLYKEYSRLWSDYLTTSVSVKENKNKECQIIYQTVKNNEKQLMNLNHSLISLLNYFNRYFVDKGQYYLESHICKTNYFKL